MALFALALAVRLFFLCVSDNDDFDAFLRLAISRSAAEHGSWSPAAFWLPGHFWLLSLPYRAGLMGPFWPRLLGVLAGAATVPVVVRLVRRWSGAGAAVAAGLLLALNPLHVRLSVLTVAEPFFYLFATLGLWFFVVYVEDGAAVRLLGGASAVALASALRLEGWALVVLLPVVALFQPRTEWRRVAAFVGLAALFPLGWGLHLYARFGDFFYVATFNAARIASAHRPAPGAGWSVLFWPAVVVGALGPVAAWVASRGLVEGRSERPARFPTLLFVLALNAVALLTLSGRIEPSARYAFLLVWLLVLGLGPGAAWLARPRTGALVAGGWLVVVWVFGGSPALAPLSPAPRFAADIGAVDGWLRREPDRSPLVVGPLRGDEWRWSAGLDAWRAPDTVKAVTSASDAAALMGRTPSGLWVVDPEAPGVAQVTGERALAPAWSAGRYAVYRW